MEGGAVREILAGVLLVESIFFAIKTKPIRNKIKIFICGLAGVLFMITMEYIEQSLWAGIGFAVSHILILFLFLYYAYEVIVEKDERKELKCLLHNCVEIPTYFYFVPSALLMTVFWDDNIKRLVIPNILLLVCVLISGIYNFKENKMFRMICEKQEQEEDETKQYIDRRNALVELFCLMTALSVGITFICIFNLYETGVITVYVLTELFVTLFIYRFCSLKLKRKLNEKGRRTIFKEKLIVPKTIGGGYTINTDNPLSYVILIVFIVIIIVLTNGMS